MSRFKNMPRAGWFIAGVAITVLLVPSVAVAAGLKFTGIEGKSGNKADVSGAGQLLTTQAAPSSFFQNAMVTLGTSGVPVAESPPGSALVITDIHVDVFSDSTPGPDNLAEFFLVTGTICSDSEVGSYRGFVNPGSVGEVDVPLAPGLGVPAGDALCGFQFGNVEADVSVSGYTVPSSEVTSGTLHRAVLPKQG